jgi:hypothetical protein
MHGVVVVHGAFMVDRENAIQILSFDGIKSGSGLSGDDGETRIEFLDILLPQERVGSFYSGDAPQTQLLRQTPCLVLPARAEELRGPTVSVYRGDSGFVRGPVQSEAQRCYLSVGIPS